MQGKHFHVDGAFNNPKPIRGDIPILIGGSGERKTLRFVAKYADGSNLFGDVERVKHLLGVLEGHCEDVGRDPAEITKTRMATVYIAPTHEAAEAKFEGGRGRFRAGAGAGLRRRAVRGRPAGAGVPRRRPGRHHASSMPDVHDIESVKLAGEALGAVIETAPRDAGRGAADRRDPQPRPPQPRRSPTPTRCSPRRSRRAAGRARTGARSPPGRRARPAARSAARTRSGSSRTACTPTASSCTRCSRSGAGCCGAGCSTRPAGWAGSWAGCTRRSTPWRLASDAVARGNLKVFAEIGYEFARYLLRGRVRRRGAAARRSRSRVTTRPSPTDDPKRRAELHAAREPVHRAARADPPAARDRRGARRAVRHRRGARADDLRDVAPAARASRGRAGAARRRGTSPGSRARSSRTRSWSCRCRAGSSRWARTCRTRTRRRCTSSSTRSSIVLVEPVRARGARAGRLRRRGLVGAGAADALHRAPVPRVPRGRGPGVAAVHRRAGPAIPRRRPSLRATC